MRMWMPDTTPDTTPDEPDIAMVEAPTAQKALEQVTARFGSRAQIVGAGKVLRGGIGGFFAREMVQLRVRVGEPVNSEPQQPAAAASGSSAAGSAVRTTPSTEPSPAVNRLLSALTGSEDARERVFADKLRSELVARGTGSPETGSDHEPTRAAVREPMHAADRESTQPPASEPNPAPTASAASTSMAARAAETAAAAARAAARVGRPATEVDDLRRRMGGSSLAVMHGFAPTGTTRPPEETSAGEPRGASVLVRHTAAAPPNDPPVAATPSAPAEPAVRVPAVDEQEQLPAVAEPTTPTSTAPAGPDTRWDAAKLRTLGLPDMLCDVVDRAGGGLAAVQSLASAVGMLCRPLPVGNQMLVGPRAGVLSPEIGVPLVLPPGPTPEHGPVAAKVGGSHRDWVHDQRRDRWVHLVVGGRGWQRLADIGPLAVSWASPEDLPAALRLAAERGLVLGYDGSRSGRRATPEDVAITLRELAVAR